jgi:hypothetical protein
MSNRVTFQVTKFVNLNNDLSEGEPAYGYRIYDDYDADYNNCLIKEELPQTAAEALAIIEEGHADFHEAILEKGGFLFNDDYVELDENGKIIEE